MTIAIVSGPASRVTAFGIHFGKSLSQALSEETVGAGGLGDAPRTPLPFTHLDRTRESLDIDVAH